VGKKTVSVTLAFGGYRIRLRIRTLRQKRTRGGRTRGKYEGEYLYVEAKSLADGKRKDLYVGPVIPDLDWSRPGGKFALLQRELELLDEAGKNEGRDEHYPAPWPSLEGAGDIPATHNGRSERKKRG
jgi:hypothetical protein